MDPKPLIEFYFKPSVWRSLLVLGILLNAAFLYFQKFELAIVVIVFTVIHVIVRLAHRLRKIAYELVTANSLGQLIEKYLAFILVALVIFTILYAIADFTHLGYITYEECSDHFVYDQVPPSHSFFYFSAVTMFTVGYGDLCPMGISKGIAIMNMLLGQMFTVVFLGAAIGNIASKR